MTTKRSAKVYIVKNPRHIAEGVRIFQSAGRDYFEGALVREAELDQESIGWLIEKGILVLQSAEASGD